MDTNNIKIQLEEEKRLLIEELSSFAKQDEYGMWMPVPDFGNGPEADDGDLANKNEDFQERASKTEILAKRLRDVEEKLANL